jgi:ribosomal protein S18 acetylase RimI-like enzyme
MQNFDCSPHAITFYELRPGEDATAFKTLNEEWISKYFALEEEDRKLLSDPEGMILKKGGHVFFAKCAHIIVGCVALVPMGDGVYELAKMSVSPEMRGRGIGRQLLRHAVQESKKSGIRSFFLGSSKKLANAVHLYESEGFQHIPRERIPVPYPYTRADIFMELPLL